MAFTIGVSLRSTDEIKATTPPRLDVEGKVYASVDLNQTCTDWGFVQGAPEELERLAAALTSAAKQARDAEPGLRAQRDRERLAAAELSGEEGAS